MVKCAFGVLFERPPRRMDGGSNQTKLLQMRARRAQVGAKLAEWEEAHRQADGREASAEERQRSSQYRQLTKLCGDLEEARPRPAVDETYILKLPRKPTSRCREADK